MFTIYAGPGRISLHQSSRLGYSFDGPQFLAAQLKPSARPASAKLYRNPIIVAREWRQALLETPNRSGADLARTLGVSRARISQVLRLLDLAPEALEAVAALGDPLTTRIVTARSLRLLIRLPAAEQIRTLNTVARQYGSRLNPSRTYLAFPG